MAEQVLDLGREVERDVGPLGVELARHRERGAAKVTRPAPMRIAARQAKIAAPVFPREPAMTSR